MAPRLRLSWFGLAAIVLAVSTPALPALAQPTSPAASLKGGAGSPPQALSPAATTAAPDRVRTLLQSIHGFTRAELDAVSADVSAVLRALIDSPAESALVRRQAVKALALYPGEATLSFISARVDTAPVGLRRLYLLGLAGFGDVDPGGVSAVLDGALDDPDATVRRAAVASAARLAHLPPVRATLQRHAAGEPDPAIRRGIRAALRGE